MKGVDTIARVRREFHQRKRSIKQIARELHISRNTVRKILRSDATALYRDDLDGKRAAIRMRSLCRGWLEDARVD